MSKNSESRPRPGTQKRSIEFSLTTPKAGKRFADYRKMGLTPIVLHLGDHHPNGLDMTRDNRDRLVLFARGAEEVGRIALNMDQVEPLLPAAESGEGDRQPLCGLRSSVWPRLLGIGRAETRGHRRADPGGDRGSD
jgi:hypothetical protein